MYYSETSYEYNLQNLMEDYLDYIRSNKSYRFDKDIFSSSVLISEVPPENLDPPSSGEVQMPNFAEDTFDMPRDSVYYIHDRDLDLMKALYSRINTTLYPYVVRVLDEYEYIGSPLYDEEIDRETIAQMVDRAIEYASLEMDEADDINVSKSENSYGNWSRWDLLRSLTEALILNDIFTIRRPRYIKLFNSNYTLKN